MWNTLISNFLPAKVWDADKLQVTAAHSCTAKSFYSRQNQLSISSRKNRFRHGKINFIAAKPFSFTAKQISSHQNHFGYLAHVTLARKVLWESIQHSGVLRGFMTQHVSLSACSVDKVSRNWLIDVSTYTQYICSFILQLTHMHGISCHSKLKGLLHITYKILLNLC